MSVMRLGLTLIAQTRSWLRVNNRLKLTRCYSTVAERDRPARDPLRILFCGSDQFSIASLQALVDIRRDDKFLIESIDVVCRPDKRAGHGSKAIRAVPIKGVAHELALPIHEVDDFAKHYPNVAKDINLVIAVSFGLLIPAKIIESARYGGLNVHPSFLPDLRGAAPIHHALLNRRSHTGVSVQTLHPIKFDHGRVIAQTALPGLPIDPDATPASLLPGLATEGANLLAHVVKSGAYLHPSPSIELSEDEISLVTDGRGIKPARRFDKADTRIDWNVMTASDIMLRQRVFGRLWDGGIYQKLSNTGAPCRIVFEGLKDISDESRVLRAIAGDLPVGTPWFIHDDTGQPRLIIFTVGDGAIEVRGCTIASKRPGRGNAELLRMMVKREDA